MGNLGGCGMDGGGIFEISYENKFDRFSCYTFRSPSF
jgi:hypothetical protein